MDREFVENAVRDYAGALVKVAYAYTKNVCDAEDIVQEVFLSLMAKKREFLSQEHLKSWLIRVTINKSKNHMKSAWIAKRFDLQGKSETNADETGLDETLSDARQEVTDAVFSLEEKYRVPIRLFYYEGYSIREIADLLGKKPATVGSWLSRGRKKLKKQLLLLCGILLLGAAGIVCLQIFRGQGAQDAEEMPGGDALGGTEYAEETTGGDAFLDLPYRFYGEDVITVEEPCTIRLENLQTLVSTEELQGVYLYDCGREVATELSVRENAVEYKVERSGSYCIYALMQDGSLLNLSGYASVETEAYFENGGKDGASENVINLLF